jgi:hypothetical protein
MMVAGERGVTLVLGLLGRSASSVVPSRVSGSERWRGRCLAAPGRTFFSPAGATASMPQDAVAMGAALRPAVAQTSEGKAWCTLESFSTRQCYSDSALGDQHIGIARPGDFRDHIGAMTRSRLASTMRPFRPCKSSG